MQSIVRGLQNVLSLRHRDLEITRRLSRALNATLSLTFTTSDPRASCRPRTVRHRLLRYVRSVLLLSLALTLMRAACRFPAHPPCTRIPDSAAVRSRLFPPSVGFCTVRRARYSLPVLIRSGTATAQTPADHPFVVQRRSHSDPIVQRAAQPQVMYNIAHLLSLFHAYQVAARWTYTQARRSHIVVSAPVRSDTLLMSTSHAHHWTNNFPRNVGA